MKKEFFLIKYVDSDKFYNQRIKDKVDLRDATIYTTELELVDVLLELDELPVQPCRCSYET